MYVNNFVQSMCILNRMARTNSALSRNIMHLASGKRINGPSDDPAAYAIMQRMDARVRSLDAAARNAQCGSSMLKTAEGAVSSTVDILRTLKEKALAAANGTCTDDDRKTIQKEVDQLIDQMDDNANVTYNGRYLVNGSSQSGAQQTTDTFTNRSLSTATTGTSTLLSLSRRNGDSLGIQSSDSVTVSYVQQGRTYTTSFTAGSSTLADIFSKANTAGGGTVFDTDVTASSLLGMGASGQQVTTPDGTSAITVKAATGGRAGQIAGFTISVSDTHGNVNRSANAVLDAFSESIQARDAAGDSSLVLQTGASANQGMRVALGDMRPSSLGLRGVDGKVIDVTTQKGASAAIDVFQNVLEKALDQETTIGAMQMRLEYTVQNLTTESENLTAAISVISDTDMAKEITEYAKNNILLQAAQAMLAQSNQNAGWFLSLLR